MQKEKQARTAHSHVPIPLPACIVCWQELFISCLHSSFSAVLFPQSARLTGKAVDTRKLFSRLRKTSQTPVLFELNNWCVFAAYSNATWFSCSVKWECHSNHKFVFFSSSSWQFNVCLLSPAFSAGKNTKIQPGSAPLALKRMINFRDSRIFFGLTIKSKQVVFLLQHMQWPAAPENPAVTVIFFRSPVSMEINMGVR